jgi:hypothetical protein
MTQKLLRIAAAIASAAVIGSLIAFPAAADLSGCNGCIEASDIARGAVRSSEIRAGAVGTSEIRNGSIRQTDLRFDPATQGELNNTAAALLTFTPFAFGQVADDGTSELSGWLPPDGTSYDAVNNRYELDYSSLPAEIPISALAVVVTPRDSTVDRSYWDIVGEEIHIYFKDEGGTNDVQTDFGLVVVA